MKDQIVASVEDALYAIWSDGNVPMRDYPKLAQLVGRFVERLGTQPVKARPTYRPTGPRAPKTAEKIIIKRSVSKPAPTNKGELLERARQYLTEGPLTATELSQKLQLTKPTTYDLLKKLGAKKTPLQTNKSGRQANVFSLHRMSKAAIQAANALMPSKSSGEAPEAKA
jgi:hypothetical protein